MTDVFYWVLNAASGAPLPFQKLRGDQLSAPDNFDPENYIKSIVSHLLKANSDIEAEEYTKQLLFSSLCNSLRPDTVEQAVENTVTFYLEKKEWIKSRSWLFAFFHYHCTDELTVSLFVEFDVPKLVLDTFSIYNSLKQLDTSLSTVLTAGCTLLGHFYPYPIGDTITPLLTALDSTKDDPMFYYHAFSTLAEYTNFIHNSSQGTYNASIDKFIDLNGLDIVQRVLETSFEDCKIVEVVVQTLVNVTNSVPTRCWDFSREVLARLFDAYVLNEKLLLNIVRLLSNSPPVRFLDIKKVADVYLSSKSQLLIEEMLCLLGALAMTDRNIKADLFRLGCVTRILTDMVLFESNLTIQWYSCIVISYLAYDSESIRTTITENGGIELVLKAMALYPDHVDLLSRACAAVSGLTFNNQKGQQIISARNGVKLIIEAMSKHNVLPLQEMGCQAIGTMCWNTELKSEAVQFGVVDLIMRALQTFPQSVGVVRNACRALAQIAYNFDRNKDDMTLKGLIPIIIHAMMEHKSQERVQIQACAALSYLSWKGEEDFTRLAEEEAVPAISGAMLNHRASAEVQTHGCRALANIANATKLELREYLHLLLSAMKIHSCVEEVQGEACCAIVSFCLISSQVKDQFYQLEISELVCTSLINFPASTFVQQEACDAIAHLAYEHAKLSEELTKLGSVKYLLTSMRCFPNSPVVQVHACGGLSALAFDNKSAQNEIFQLGGVPLILRAMFSFERLRILELGCSVLGTLAWNADIKERVAMEAIPGVLEIMRRHGSNSLLQKSTCRAISQFAFNSEANRRLLTSNGAIPLIVKAMDTHINCVRLLFHALKALTYLCWENTPVVQAILDENAQSILGRIQAGYGESERIHKEAVHLSKILFRKICGSPVKSPSTLPNHFSPIFSTSSTLGTGTPTNYQMPQMDTPIPDMGYLYSSHSPTGTLGRGGGMRILPNIPLPTANPHPFDFLASSKKGSIYGGEGGSSSPLSGDSQLEDRGHELDSQMTPAHEWLGLSESSVSSSSVVRQRYARGRDMISHLVDFSYLNM